MTNQHLVIFNTCPDFAIADLIATTLVQERLAACVNQVPGITSVYRWEGKIQRDSEVLLVIKSSTEIFNELQQRVLELHPYDVPELVALPITIGLPAYLHWLSTEVGAA